MLQSSSSIFRSSMAYVLFDTILFAVGTLCLLILLRRFLSQKDRLQNGVFATSSNALCLPAAHTLPARRIFRLFLAPSMIVFLILSALQVLLLLILSVIYGAVGYV